MLLEEALSMVPLYSPCSSGPFHIHREASFRLSITCSLSHEGTRWALFRIVLWFQPQIRRQSQNLDNVSTRGIQSFPRSSHARLLPSSILKLQEHSLCRNTLTSFLYEATTHLPTQSVPLTTSPGLISFIA